MKIAFALVAHEPTDERVYYQQAASLQQAGCEVFIVSSRTTRTEIPASYCFDDTGIPKKQLIKKLAAYLTNLRPDVVICDNPLAVLAARTYRKKNKHCRIVQDITEWYPSKKNLYDLPVLKKLSKALLLAGLSFVAAFSVNGFIFGEYYKARPFRIFFFWKKYTYLSYYATPGQIATYPVNDITERCSLFYSGSLTAEKGFDRVLEAAVQVASKYPQIPFILTLVTGTSNYDFPATLPSNLTIRQKGILPFPDFCSEIGKHDIFFDLRKKDFENTRCLPIKLFYYLACGRPVVYTRLKAISKEVPEINEVGFLVDPRKTEEIVSAVSRYLENPAFYQNHCHAATQLVSQKYNWNRIQASFAQFILNP